MYWKLEDKSNFYPTLVEMWKSHNFPVMPINRVANRIFTMYSNEGVILYAVQVYITDSTMCQLSFPTSNKQASSEDKRGALENLIEIIQVCMKYEGYDLIYTTSAHPKIIKILNEKGFYTGDENVTYYSKPL